MTLTVENKVGKEAWLEGYSDSTKIIYSLGFDLFLEFMDETEKGTWTDLRLIKERAEDLKTRTFAFEQKLVEFYEWLKNYKPETVEEFSDNTRKSYLKAVRSILAYHRLDIRFTRQQKSKIGKKAKPKLKYYDFTLEDIRKMAGVSKPKERYVLLVGKDIGFRRGDFIALKQGTFIAHIDEEPPISLGEIYTQKEGVIAKPFLGSDGKQVVKEWLTVLRSKGKYNPDKPMLQIDEKELTTIVQTLTERANITTGNERVRFHSLRVFQITRLSKVMETNRWKQIVGKEVPESAYVKPFLLREDYRKALPLTTISQVPAESEDLQSLRREYESLKAEVERLRISPEDLRTLRELLRRIKEGKIIVLEH